MVQSLNTQADFYTKANVIQGLSQKHGQILIGNRAIEFYNFRNPNDFIQIPWKEIQQIRAHLYCQDRYIRGFSIDTKQGVSFNFVVTKAGKTLKMMRPYLEEHQIVRHKPLLRLQSIRDWLKRK